MGEEVSRILKLLEDGKINSDEAERLINAVSGKKSQGFVVPPPPRIPKDFMMKVETIPDQIGKAISAAFGSVGTSGGKKTFSGIDKVNMKIVSGNLDLRPTDGEFTIDGTGWPLRTMAEKNQLYIDAINAELTAKITPKSKATLNLVSADLSAESIDGEITVDAISGDITLDNCAGRWSVRTISGDIDANGIEGKIVMASKSGDIALKISGNGGFAAKSISGDIQVCIPAGKTISLRIEEGDGERQIPPELESAMATSPENADIALDLSTRSGDISIEIE